MGFACMGMVATAAGIAALFLSASLSAAQTSEPKAGNPRPQADGEALKKVDEFAEAAKNLSGPAGYPECVWLGRRAVNLLTRDDLDTAFRHMELYDRFGCPANHIQAAFRCVVRQGNPDLKAPDTLSARIHSCWINPTPEISTPSAAAGPATTSNR